MGESLWRRVLFPARRPVEGEPRRVLALTASEPDRAFYRSLESRGPWELKIAASLPEALRTVRDSPRPFPIVLCDRDLPGYDWRDMLTQLVDGSPGSCVLLVSHVSDEFLWREVVKLGGYDVVGKPLSERAVNPALLRAWSYWKAEPPRAQSPA